MKNNSSLKLLVSVAIGIICFLNSKTPVMAVNCSAVPSGGTYHISNTCSFANPTDGVDTGIGNAANTAELVIDNGGNLTIDSGQTIAVGSITITSGGVIGIIRNAGAQIKVRTPIYMVDADGDGYAASTSQYTTSGAGRVRRNTLTSISAIDCNDVTANGGASVWRNITGYADADGDGISVAGSTQVCSGAALPSGYLASASSPADANDAQYCPNISYNPAGACNKCSNGAYANQTASEDLFSECAPSFTGCSGDNKTGPGDTCNNVGACGNQNVACAAAQYCSSGTCSALASPTITAHTNDCGANSAGLGRARATFSWNAVPGATSYTLWIFNGRFYEAHNIGNVTSWSSDGKGWWPSPAAIDAWAAGGWDSNIFCDGSMYCANGGGANLAVDPNYMYLQAAGSYTTTHGYYWIHISSNSVGGNSSGTPGAGATWVGGENFPYYAGVFYDSSPVCGAGACLQGRRYYSMDTCQVGWGLLWTQKSANTACSPTYPINTYYDGSAICGAGACLQGRRYYTANSCTAGTPLAWKDTAANTACNPTYPVNTLYDASPICGAGPCLQGQRSYSANSCTAGTPLYWSSSSANTACNPTYPINTLYDPSPICYGGCQQGQRYYNVNSCTAGSGVAWGNISWQTGTDLCNYCNGTPTIIQNVAGGTCNARCLSSETGEAASCNGTSSNPCQRRICSSIGTDQYSAVNGLYNSYVGGVLQCTTFAGTCATSLNSDGENCGGYGAKNTWCRCGY